MAHRAAEQVAAGFNAVADTYDHPALRGLVLAAERLVETVQLRPGEHVLDVGMGTGHAALAAAIAVGPDGRVVGVEIAENMRAKAQEKVAASDLRNVEIRAGDAAALPLPDASVDVVICASAVYTFPDIPAALKEWWRVLKPGGRAAFSSLAGDKGLRFYSRLLGKYGVPIPAELPTQRVDSPAKCIHFLQQAGFVDAAAHTEQLGYFVPELEQCWALIWNTGARIPLQHLPLPVVEQIKAEYLASLAASVTDQGVWIDWPVIFCRGEKSANCG